MSGAGSIERNKIWGGYDPASAPWVLGRVAGAISPDFFRRGGASSAAIGAGLAGGDGSRQASKMAVLRRSRGDVATGYVATGIETRGNQPFFGCSRLMPGYATGVDRGEGTRGASIDQGRPGGGASPFRDRAPGPQAPRTCGAPVWRIRPCRILNDGHPSENAKPSRLPMGSGVRAATRRNRISANGRGSVGGQSGQGAMAKLSARAVREGLTLGASSGAVNGSSYTERALRHGSRDLRRDGIGRPLVAKAAPHSESGKAMADPARAGRVLRSFRPDQLPVADMTMERATDAALSRRIHRQEQGVRQREGISAPNGCEVGMPAAGRHRPAAGAQLWRAA